MSSLVRPKRGLGRGRLPRKPKVGPCSGSQAWPRLCRSRFGKECEKGQGSGGRRERGARGAEAESGEWRHGLPGPVASLQASRHREKEKKEGQGGKREKPGERKLRGEESEAAKRRAGGGSR